MRLNRATFAVCGSVVMAGCGVSGDAPSRVAAPVSLAISADRPLPRGIGVPAVAAARDGTVAAFSGRIAIRAPDGHWGTPRALADPAFAVGSPHVVMDALGGVTVAWIRLCRVGSLSSCAGRQLVQARSASAAGAWGPIETLGRAGYDPALALAAEAGGGATVAWEANAAVNVASHVAGRRFGRVRSFARNGPEDGGTTALATSADGRAYVAFATAPPGELEQAIPQSFVAVAARDREGRWGAPRQVSGRPAAQPRVTVAADGAIVVAWRESSFNADDMPRYGGVGAAIGTADGRFAAPLHVADARTTGLLLAAGRSGETVLAWSSPSETGGPLDYAVRARKAAGFGAVRRAPGVSADLIGNRSALAMLDDGTTLFAGPDGDRAALRLAARPQGGEFSLARRVIEGAHEPVIAASGSHATLVYLARHERPRFVAISPG